MKKFTLIGFCLIISLALFGQEQKKQVQTSAPLKNKTAISRQQHFPEEITSGHKKQGMELMQKRMKQERELHQTLNAKGKASSNKILSDNKRASSILEGAEKNAGNSLPVGMKNAEKKSKSAIQQKGTERNVVSAGLKSVQKDAKNSSRMNQKENRGESHFVRNEKRSDIPSGGIQQQTEKNNSSRRLPLIYGSIQTRNYPGPVKKAGTKMQKLDSIVETGEQNGSPVNNRTLYGYDANGNCIEEIDFEWAPLEELRQSYKVENTFDSYGNLTSSIEYNWDQAKGQWVPYNTKWESIFDANGNEILYTVFYWDYSSGQYANSEKTETQYDINGFILMEADYLWEPYYGKWIGNYKYESSYDETGNEILYQQYSWNYESDQWIYSDKTEQLFDANGNYLLYSEYSWDIFSNSWVGVFKEEYSYDLKGNNILYAYYEGWNSDLNNWIGSSKDEYEYDSEDNMMLWKQFSWDSNTNNWLWYRKSTYTYDINNIRKTLSRFDFDDISSDWVLSIKGDYFYIAGDLMSYINEFSWDKSSSQWINYSKREWQYDANNVETSFSYFYWNADLSVWEGDYKEDYMYDANYNMILRVYYDDWNTETSQWIPTLKYEYGYNSENKLIASTRYEWDNNLFLWLGAFKRDYYYNEYGNRQTAADYYWDSYQNLWLGNGSKYEATFDAAGNQTTYAYYTYYDSYNNQWIGDRKWTQTYNETGKLLTTINYYWDYVQVMWVYSDKSEYFRDVNGKELYWNGYEWNPDQSTWIIYYRQINTFDAFGVQLTSDGYYWNPATNTGTADDKNEYFRDNNGKLITWKYSKWDESTSQWIENQIVEYSYNASGKNTFRLQYTLQPSENYIWVPDYQSLYGYDATGNLISAVSNEPGYEGDKYREEYLYDGNGKITGYIAYQWDNYTKHWVPEYKENLVYNGNGKISFTLDVEWYDGTATWINSAKTEYSYDGNGIFTGTTEYEWDAETSQWINSYKNQRTINANNNCIADLDYYWNDGTNTWENDEWDGKNEYTYTTEGKLLSKTRSYWMTDHFEPIEKSLYTYNAAGKPSVEQNQNWDGSLMLWLNTYKHEYSYDANLNLTGDTEFYWNGDSWNPAGYTMERTYDISIFKNQLYLSWDYLEEYEDDYFGYSLFEDIMDVEDKFYHEWYIINNKLLEEKNFSINLETSGTSVRKTTFYYSENVGIEELTKSGISLEVYPNPFTAYTTINYILSEPQFIEIAIYDQLGRQVENLVNSKTDAGSHEIIWQAGRASSGIYHLKMRSKEGIITKQIVINK